MLRFLWKGEWHEVKCTAEYAKAFVIKHEIKLGIYTGGHYWVVLKGNQS